MRSWSDLLTVFIRLHREVSKQQVARDQQALHTMWAARIWPRVCGHRSVAPTQDMAPMTRLPGRVTRTWPPGSGHKEVATRTRPPGNGRQEMAAKMWSPVHGRKNFVTRTWPQGSGHKDVGHQDMVALAAMKWPSGRGCQEVANMNWRSGHSCKDVATKTWLPLCGHQDVATTM